MKVPVRKCVPLFGLIVLAALCVMPQMVEAGVVSVWPDRFQPTQTDYGYRRQLDFVSALGDECIFSAEVKVPVGATITRLQYVHQGYIGASTWVVLFRVKMGAAEQLMTLASSTQSDGHIALVNDIGSVGHPVVEAGYRYYARIYSANVNSTIRGVRVYYTK